MKGASIDKAVELIRSSVGPAVPEIALILGSGLGFFADTSVDVPIKIAYSRIPGFPESTAPLHEGNLVVGKLRESPESLVCCLQGRFHRYEGYSLDQIAMPVKILARWGVPTLVVTNAAGGINESFNPGDLMLIDDHINFLGSNPLIGSNAEEFGPRFPDMTYAYDPQLKEIALSAARAVNVPMKRGVYVAVCGPSFETPAEIRAFRLLGADAVGMSTVPEVIAARHAGMRVLGISCITNVAAGMAAEEISHENIEATAAAARGSFSTLVSRILAICPTSQSDSG